MVTRGTIKKTVGEGLLNTLAFHPKATNICCSAGLLTCSSFIAFPSVLKWTVAFLIKP